LSLKEDYLDSLLHKMISIKDKLRGSSKKKLDKALKEWWRENILKRRLLKDALSDLYEIED
jgi:hypothetical protein